MEKRKTVAFNEIDINRFEEAKKNLPSKYNQRMGLAKFVHDKFDEGIEQANNKK